jgi:hypothetical protein
MNAHAAPTRRRSTIPAIVVFVCLPFPAVTALGQLAWALRSADERSFLAIGFASTLAYVVIHLPALVLFEPFAIGASIWYTRRFTSVAGESFGGLIACWAAVLVHTAAIAFSLRGGWR